jgi:hypothetical protein
MDHSKDFASLSAMLGSSESNPPAYDFLSGILGAVQTPAKPNGIFFARNSGESVRFSEPSQLPGYIYGLRMPPVPGAGLYAILVADNSASPRPFRVIYFGESECIDERVSPSHEKYEDWCTAAGGADKLHVAYCWMIGSSKDERTAVESGLIGHYHPQCNIVYNSFASIFAEYTGPAVVPSPEPPECLSQIAKMMFGSK